MFCLLIKRQIKKKILLHLYVYTINTFIRGFNKCAPRIYKTKRVFNIKVVLIIIIRIIIMYWLTLIRILCIHLINVENVIIILGGDVLNSS